MIKFKFITVVISLLICTNLYAEEAFKKYSISELGSTGIISKEKFGGMADAVQFCQDNNAEMIDGQRMMELILFMAISGMISQDPFLKDAVIFNLESKTLKESGAWFWILEENKVGLWYDGKGFTTDVFSVEELNQMFPGNEVALPAICELK